VLDPRAFLINSKTGRVVAATFVEFLSGNSTNPSICFTDSPDSGLQCDNTGAVNYVKNGINLGELGTASSLIGGSDTQIQFNDSGSFGGSADLTWDDTGKELGVGGDINLDDGGTYETTVQVVTPTANRTISFPDATGTVALVAGSNGQLTYNSSGAQAGLTSVSIGSTGEINISLAGAESTPPVSFTGSWFTGGTATTTKPQLLIEPTGTTSTAWSTSGTGLGVNAASGFSGRLLDLQLNGTSRMVVQGDGHVGIGTTGPSQLLDVRSSSGATQGLIGIGDASLPRILVGYTPTGSPSSNDSAAVTADNLGSITLSTRSAVANNIHFNTSTGTGAATERLRITTDGSVLVNTTAPAAYFDGRFRVVNSGTGVSFSTSGSAAQLVQTLWHQSTSGDNGFVSFGTEASYSQRGTITYNRAGGVVAYNTTSDYRSKTILGDLENSGATIDALKVYRGVMNGATVERPMLIAHEAQAVAPYCVTGEKDAVDDDNNPIYQQMDHQVLVPLLIAEIQQLRARVAALEGV